MGPDGCQFDWMTYLDPDAETGAVSAYGLLVALSCRRTNWTELNPTHPIETAPRADLPALTASAPMVP
jgi:hypothetical protein